MSDLGDILWMRNQWQRFRRLLLGAIGLVWALCTSGILVLNSEDPAQWFYTRWALLGLLTVATLVAVWLFAHATREIRSLGRLAVEARLEEARTPREPKKGRR